MSRILPYLLFGVLLLTACEGPEVVHLHGRTMGTTWSVSIYGRVGKTNDLKRGIQATLDDVDGKASTWRADTPISRFNAWQRTTPFPMPSLVLQSLRRAKYWWKATHGAFDVTIEPLVRAYGFDVVYRRPVVSRSEKQKLLQNVGMRYLVLGKHSLRKLRPGVWITLSGIVKGRAVDMVTTYLQKEGFTNFVVEVGGEIFVAGKKGKAFWRIGIRKPSPNAEGLLQVLKLENMGIATSGTLYNAYRKSGKIYTHIIDPRTGDPVRSGADGATVIMARTEDADALATAMIVLGREGLTLADARGWAVALATRGDPHLRCSRAFVRFVKERGGDGACSNGG